MISTLKHLTAVCSFALLSTAAFAQGAVNPKEVNGSAVSGNMVIDFKSRTDVNEKGEPNKGALDIYDVHLTVDKDGKLPQHYDGKITRSPRIKGRFYIGTSQDAGIKYDLDIGLTLNGQKQKVGTWTGFMPIDPKTGRYDLAGGGKVQQPLRILVNPMGQQAKIDEGFSGLLQGLPAASEGTTKKLKLWLQGKERTFEAKTDPMNFLGINLAGGPVSAYPSTAVNGNLDFDYNSNNYLTDGITFEYKLGGKAYKDTVTGAIAWDKAQKAYQFNLRFNEEKFRGAADAEAAIAEPETDELALVTLDKNMPTLTGTISYKDTNQGDVVARSEITYDLKANKLTKQQIIEFLKLWLICVGPTNDE